MFVLKWLNISYNLAEKKNSTINDCTRLPRFGSGIFYFIILFLFEIKPFYNWKALVLFNRLFNSVMPILTHLFRNWISG